MSQVVVGTAGHIDHGKTSLVKALTGTNTDRLAEEKKRGMTIDLGFAYLTENITIIDVPGHEKFIRNMAAGAANIHFGLLVIAADDSVMPQTCEHLNILTLLGVNKGIVALTKTDLVNDGEWLDLVELDISDLLDDPDKVIRGLKHLRFGGNVVIVFQILDPDELKFPFERATKFHDPESADELMVMPSQVRTDYIQAIEELVAKYDRDLKLVNVDYHLVDTSKPLDLSLMHYLSTRSRRG